MTDYRAHQTPVRRQGKRKTCVGFAVGAAHEWQLGTSDWMSAEDAIWAGHTQGGDHTREATSVQLALQGLDRHRHATEQAWPYGDPAWPGDRPTAARETDNQHPLAAWSRLADASLATILAALEHARPVIVTVRFVPAAWWPGPVIDAGAGAKVKGNHAVLACGTTTEQDGALVLFKNSWGAQWGDRGFGFLTEQYLENHGVCAHSLN